MVLADNIVRHMPKNIFGIKIIGVSKKPAPNKR